MHVCYVINEVWIAVHTVRCAGLIKKEWDEIKLGFLRQFRRSKDVPISIVLQNLYTSLKICETMHKMNGEIIQVS